MHSVEVYLLHFKHISNIFISFLEIISKLNIFELLYLVWSSFINFILSHASFLQIFILYASNCFFLEIGRRCRLKVDFLKIFQAVILPSLIHSFTVFA